MNNQSLLDGVAALSAIGGAIAATITNSVATMAVPLAGAVMLQIINRQQLVKELDKHRFNVKEIVDNLQSIEQQNQFRDNQQETIVLLNEKLQQNQSAFSSQLQQQKENYLTHVERQLEASEQLQQLIYSIKEQMQNLETKQQGLKYIIDELKQIENVSQALLHHQNAFEMYYERALSHQHLGNLKGAIADFTNAIQINPHYAKAYHLRGLIKANLGDYRGAVSDLRYAAKYYFDQGDLENYKETRSLSKAYCDGENESELDAPTINQENFEPITANHLFEVN
ncbi:tetratricopeptide repeat protein [Chroococcus sp. FPU101]|uniref:tetratricopeptide repeat protein n=1 Tax=Chroococcus sp. FPU101 TaxID=1974212 RepID=UPI001A90B67F|nr:tetratricopeptide repeat protein [Chroococcus sp. FPU101]GFE70525.1 hypothetical protein CFPU101_31350 [Chroococcus sp. FPU101]